VEVAPAFRLVANSQDVTDTIRQRFKSLRYVDETGSTSDTLEIDLADHDPDAPIAMPATGAELELFLGYDDQVERMGMFVCDEIELNGPPSGMTIRARAAPYEKSTGGANGLQSQKSRSWKKDTTIGAVVKKIAGEHGLTASVDPDLASVKLPHTDQTGESDSNLLVRLSYHYSAVTKPQSGHLIFTRRGQATSVGGEPMPKTGGLAPKDCTRWRVTLARRDSPGTVVAYYRDNDKAERREVKIGDGDPVKRLRMQHKDKASAEAAVKATQQKRAREEQRLTITVPGRPSLKAESILSLPASLGWRDGIAGDWLVTRVEHAIGTGEGYRCEVECERPNSHPEVVKATAGQVDDQVQDAEEVGG
jgi:phage protein D